ncbi:MAG: Lrp/AsnC family transcriptional regulator [Candidatus Micrarchaeota archaeon]|nr:Lrp/AsnC family transcriptional regulator [Candidatus Micrarchaeota archaeon]
MPKLDLKDRRILYFLDMNARMPIGELAKKTGVSRQVALYRINKMKKEGIIQAALTIFDSVLVGYNWFRVLIRLGGAGKVQKQQLLEFLSNHPSAMWVGEVGGNWDVIVNFITKDNYSFNTIFEDFLNKYGKFVKAYEILVYINVRDQSRIYLLDDKIKEEQLERKYFVHSMKFNSELGFDDLDKQIVDVISTDAFLSNLQIANKLGVSDKTVTARIKKMEQNKLILGYRAMIHPFAIGYEVYMLFLGINNLQSDREKQLNNFLLASQNVTFVVNHIGRWRIGVEVEVKNRIEFQSFVVELRDKFGDVISDFETFPIFKDHTFNYFPEGNLKANQRGAPL